jgi:hypothetical protein
MATYGKQDFTSFRGVNIRGSIAFRFPADTIGNESTLTVKPAEDAPYQWYFPQMSGTFPIMGSFVVQLPAIAATTNMLSTVVTVTGIRAEDALTVTMGGGTTAGYGEANISTSGATAKIFFNARAGNGNITLFFVNLGVATGYTEHVMHYSAVR